MITFYFNCRVCGNGYSDIDTLEFHLRKEHTKNELIHILKLDELLCKPKSDGILLTSTMDCESK